MLTLESIIEKNLKMKVEQGSRSGTVTARLHEMLNEYVCQILWNGCYNKDEWCIAPANEYEIVDAWGETFSLDNSIFIKKAATIGANGILAREEVASIASDLGDPSVSLLIKHHVSSYNKNRFNNGCHEIGEIARAVYDAGGNRTERPLIMVSFIGNIVPKPTKGVWGYEETSPLSTATLIDRLFSSEDVKVKKVEISYQVEGLDRKLLNTQEKYNDWIASSSGFVKVNKSKENELKQILLSFTPQGFSSGGTLGKKFK